MSLFFLKLIDKIRIKYTLFYISGQKRHTYMWVIAEVSNIRDTIFIYYAKISNIDKWIDYTSNKYIVLQILPFVILDYLLDYEVPDEPL